MIAPVDLLSKIPPLASGAHKSIKQGACVMEAVSYVAGKPWSDCPECVCPVLGAFLRSWNDSLSDDERDTLLRPLILDLVGTRSTSEVEQRRATMAVDWLIREHTPAWLRLAGLTTHADALASMPEITDFGKWLTPTLNVVCRDAKAAEEAAQTVAFMAGKAARETAWESAGEAAMDAAWSVRGAVWSAKGAAMDAARAAWEAAGNAATAAAAGVSLKPTEQALRQSALVLVRRMIAVQP